MKYNWLKTGDNLADNLGVQFQKVVRLMNQNQFKTRYRYVQANQRFIRYVAKEFKLQKLANIKDKHLENYTNTLNKAGKSHKYIKTELSGIRFLHNSMSNTKFELLDAKVFNKQLGLSSTPDGRADRAWEEIEIQKMQLLFNQKGETAISDVIEGVRATGMRLDEICSLRGSDVRKALETGKLHLTNTKGGVPRDVQMNERAKELFMKKFNEGNSGVYFFTPASFSDNREIHKFKKQVQNKLYYNRSKVQNINRSSSGHNLLAQERGALTVHGLRHAYAREEYFRMRKIGLNKYRARLETAKQLGHGRDSVTEIYLAGLEG